MSLRVFIFQLSIQALRLKIEGFEPAIDWLYADKYYQTNTTPRDFLRSRQVSQ